MLLSQSRRAFHWLFCRPFLLGGKLHETIMAYLPLHWCPILDKFCDMRSNWQTRYWTNTIHPSRGTYWVSNKRQYSYVSTYMKCKHERLFKSHISLGITCLKNGKVKQRIAQYIVGCPILIKAPSDCLLDTAALISNVSSVSWILEMQLIEPSHFTK